MSLIAPPEAERTEPDAQALIAEARAHARRRRLKVAAALVMLAVMTVAGVLIGRALARPHAAAPARPRPPAAAASTGIITGHLSACFAIPPSKGRWPVTPGTVVALRGRVTEKPAGPGAWVTVFPNGPAVASEHISNNYDQTFRLALPPGKYVIAGHYDSAPARVYGPFREVTVTAGASIRVDLPDVCM
jgi:hypothetical protein